MIDVCMNTPMLTPETVDSFRELALRTESSPKSDTPLAPLTVHTLASIVYGISTVGHLADDIKRKLFYARSALKDATVESSTQAALNLSIEKMRLLHSMLGVITEAAEYVETLWPHIHADQPLDVTNLRAESGDLNWYLQIPASIFDWSLVGTLEVCLQKLKARYPDGFTSDRALNRDLDREGEAMQGVGGNTPQQSG